MIKQPIYQQLATKIDAMKRCLLADELPKMQWAEKHQEAIQGIMEDYVRIHVADVTFNFVESNGDKLVFHLSYCHISQSGYREGYLSFKAKVTASLIHGFTMTIAGRDKDGIKDVLHELLSVVLNQSVEVVQVVSD